MLTARLLVSIRAVLSPEKLRPRGLLGVAAVDGGLSSEFRKSKVRGRRQLPAERSGAEEVRAAGPPFPARNGPPYRAIRTGGLDGALVDRFAGYRGHLETVSELNEIRSG